MKPERGELAAAGAGEITRHEQRALEALGQGLEAGGEIDGGTDRREVEPVDSADITEDDLAEMEADAGAELDAAFGLAPLVEAVDPVEAAGRGGEGGIRGIARRAVGVRENREQAVAMNFSTSPPCSSTGSVMASK